MVVGLSCQAGTLNSAELGKRENAAATLPNGRRITPEGTWVPVAPYPYALAVRPDGEQIVLPSIGWPFSLNILDVKGSEAQDESITIQRIPKSSKNDPDIQVHAGVAYSPDGTLLYTATGDTGAVDITSASTWRRVTRISLDGLTAGKRYSESFSAALALSSDGKLLYVLDQANWRVVVIDTRAYSRVSSIPTGANPYTVVLSPDNSRLYITNSGLFEYKTISGVDAKDILHTGIPFPPFGYPSKAAREGVTIDGHQVPGLSEENNLQGSSLWTYQVSDASRPTLLAKLRLGEPIVTDASSTGGNVVGGASPTGVAASRERVFVSLAHDDSVVVVSADGSKLLKRMPLTPFSGTGFLDSRGRPLRGIMPAGLALHESRLYVTEAGINAVAVIDTDAERVLGHLPVGWFPTAVAVARDGRRLYVVNTKGEGSGPNAGSGFHPQNTGSYVGELEFGSLSILKLKDEKRLPEFTAAVVKNNESASASSFPLPRIRHVFLIVRENRTYDEIFGDLPGGDGDATLARWGMSGWLENAPGDNTIRVTPNAHALANRFATSDRFFVDSDVSADGHRWVVGAAPTPWFHLAWTSNYGGRRTSNSFSAAPGRRAMNGGADAPMPEDEPEYGSLWEHVASAGLAIRNYGEGLEVEGGEEMDGTEPSGQRMALNAPVPQPVFASTDRDFPTFNLGIPDQYRYAEFAKDFAQQMASGATPSLVVIRLPGDHTASPRGRDGYPDRASYVADNDLALGKIVEFLSHQAIWKDSAIFVTEDDAQGGVDHVDAHRSVLLVMGPYVRKGFLSHQHTSMGSLQKTIYELLGIGSLNLEDKLAADLSDMFTLVPDVAPFNVLPADKRIFDPAQARLARPRNAEQARELLDCDDAKEIKAEAGREARLVSRRSAGGSR